MNIHDELIKIAKARMAYKKEHGVLPKTLTLKSGTLDSIKLALYQGSPIDPKDVPLSVFEGMTIVVDDDLSSEQWKVAS